MEVFRKARTAIEYWVDDEKHRPLVLSGDIAAMQREPEVQAILLESSKYGSPMLEKLQAHLAFLLENRRKYHAAYSAYFGSSAKK